MASYYAETLAAARLLVSRTARPRGRMPAALVRRSISTAYYALFHFLLEEATYRVVGASTPLTRRRRIVARAFTHTGMRFALEKVQKPNLAGPLQGYFGLQQPPAFARVMGQAFSHAQELRHEADYDLNASLSETDALLLLSEVQTAIQEWQSARTAADRDFKAALCLLMLLKGEFKGR
jgi:hypothetical protein